MTDIITWTRPLLKSFEAATIRAAAERRETFTFAGHEFVVGYARYLIEFLDGRLA